MTLALAEQVVDIPGGWVTVIVALLTFVLGPIVTIILSARMSHQVKETREQVTNSHSTNMRVELDERHAALMGELTGIQTTLKDHTRDIGGIREEQRLQRRDMGQLREELAETRSKGSDDHERLIDLERTQPQSRRPRRPRNQDKE